MLTSTIRSTFGISLSTRLSKRFMSAHKIYTQDHEWLQLNSDSTVATLGITDYAQKALGDVVYVEVPKPGLKLKPHDPVGAVESVKAASDVYSPLSGEVVEGNVELVDEPGLINSSPEDGGWIAKIRVSDKSQLEGLMDGPAYDEFCKSK